MKYRDIEGAFPKKMLHHLRNYAFDDYSDVTKKKKRILRNDYLTNFQFKDFHNIIKDRLRNMKQEKLSLFPAVNKENNANKVIKFEICKIN